MFIKMVALGEEKNDLAKISNVKEEDIESYLSSMDPQVSQLPIVMRIKFLLETFRKERAIGLTKNLWVKEAKEKDWPNGKDIIIKAEEIERHDNYSIFKTTFPPGTSPQSVMVQLSNLNEYAILTGKLYYITLKDWQGTDFKSTADSMEGSVFSKIGFSDSRDIDLKKVFDTDLDDERLTGMVFTSVLSFYMIEWLDLREPQKAWNYK